MHVGIAGWSREACRGDHRAFLRLFERADALGFDSAWLTEYHFDRDDPYPSPLLLASAIAARTERIRLGLSVIVLPLHQPLLLAEALAQLDFQSHGRLDVGLGRGTRPPTFAALGLPIEEARSRFEEAYEIVIRAWSQPVVSFEGRHWQLENVAVGPAPVQRPHPPVWIAGYTRETLAFAHARGVPVLLSLEPPEGRQLQVQAQLAAESGSRYDVSAWSLARYVCIGRTRAEAAARVDDLLPKLHARRQRFAALRGEPATGIAPRSRESFLREQAIAGTPDECIAQIQEIARTIGTTHLRGVFNGNGVLDDNTALHDMALFAQDVLPAVRELSKSPEHPAGAPDPAPSQVGEG